MRDPAETPESRLRTVRRVKWAALAVALAGAAAAGIVAVSSSSESPAGSGAARAVSERRLAGDRERAPAAPRLVAPPAPPRKTGPTRRFTVRVNADGEPAPGVFVRAIRHDAKSSTATELGDPVRTDADGRAALEVDEPLPSPAWLEMARADPTGVRHGFAPLDRIASARAGEEPIVELPAGGSLRIDVQGLPPSDTPRKAVVALQAPYGEWLGLFEDVRVHAAADGGPSERRAIPSEITVPLDAQGSGSLAHVPDTFVVAVRLYGIPEGFIAEEVTCSGPSMPASEGRVLRVPQGRVCTYTLRWKPLPSIRVRVRGPDGTPVAGAQVGAAVREKGSGARAHLSPEIASADGSGVASVPLWSGASLPDWRPEAVVVAVVAPGRRAAVATVEGGRWYGNEVTVVLEAGTSGRFRVSGTLAYPSGGAASGIPLLLESTIGWNGERMLPPFSATTDGDGRWSFSVPEDARPLFEFGGGLRVRVDGDALENMSDHALWRSASPSLPRAGTSPEKIPLPPKGGAAEIPLTLSLPD